jgi:transposase
MSKKELRRLPVIHRVMENRLSQVKAAEMLDLSDRQIRRIVGRIRAGGDQAIVHGGRGKGSPFKMEDDKEKQIMRAVEKKYYDFGPKFASEKLLESEKIKVSKEKLRQLMIAHGIDYPGRKKKAAIHHWRERKHHRGEMVQMDGSDHNWLEGRGPRLILMGYIDDASSEVFARFYEYEGTFSAMDSFRRYIAGRGLPLCLYVDRHSTYRTTRQPNLDEDLKGEFARTQFARALNELGVKIIFANSPQAKGRIERAFETLQDRLVKELRLAGISTLKEANAFLEGYILKHNASFAVKPLRRTDLHRPVLKSFKLDEIFCLKEYRTIGNGYTFQWRSRLFLVKDPSITMRKQRVCVMEDFKGNISLKLKNKYLPFTEVTRRDVEAMAGDRKELQKLIRKERIYYAPPPKNHPWRHWVYSRKTRLSYA